MAAIFTRSIDTKITMVARYIYLVYYQLKENEPVPISIQITVLWISSSLKTTIKQVNLDEYACSQRYEDLPEFNKENQKLHIIGPPVIHQAKSLYTHYQNTDSKLYADTQFKHKNTHANT